MECAPSDDIARSKKVSENCGCIDGYFENLISGVCEKCSNEYCKTCDSNGDCVSCNSPF